MRPVRLHLTAGQISGFDGARNLAPNLPAAKFLLADKGYDANWFRDGLIGKGIWLCIPPNKNRNVRSSMVKYGAAQIITSSDA